MNPCLKVHTLISCQQNPNQYKFFLQLLRKLISHEWVTCQTKKKRLRIDCIKNEKMASFEIFTRKKHLLFESVVSSLVTYCRFLTIFWKVLFSIKKISPKPSCEFLNFILLFHFLSTSFSIVCVFCVDFARVLTNLLRVSLLNFQVLKIQWVLLVTKLLLFQVLASKSSQLEIEIFKSTIGSTHSLEQKQLQQ